MIVDSINAFPVLKMSALFTVLFMAGLITTLPLYNFNLKKLYKSTLFIKIMFWVPIYLVFIGSLYLSNLGRLTVILLLIVMSYKDLVDVLRRVKVKNKLARIYFGALSLSLLHFYLLGFFDSSVTDLLIVIGMSSVLADVFAFFMGNYFGKHKLPDALNSKKSWEGVSGQIIGAYVGVILVDSFVLDVGNLWVFLPIGIGSAAGDLMNSYVKRKLSIKDWSNRIPGHGGFIDRLSSLAGSAVLTFYWVLIIRG